MRMPEKGINKLEFTLKESIENQIKKWGDIYNFLFMLSKSN